MAENNRTEFYCDFCNFSCKTPAYKRFFKHLFHFHSNEPNFKVYCRYCCRSFTKVNSLRKHFQREHQDIIDYFNDKPEFNLKDSGNFSDENEEDNLETETASENLKHHVGKCLLCGKEMGESTQNALDMVKDSPKNLLNKYFSIVKQTLVDKIRDETGTQFEFSQDMDELFEVDKVFEGLNTEYQQQLYYKEKFNLVVRTKNL
jgi:hypothetical protein